MNGITLGGRFVPMQIHKMGDSMANLSLDVLKRDDDYTLSFEYRSDLYTPRTIQQFAKLLVSAVKGFLAGGLLKDIPLCGEDDLAAYKSFNENTVAVDRGLTLVDLFRKQAAETPERNAVVYRDKTLTYRRLDELSESSRTCLQKRASGRRCPSASWSGAAKSFRSVRSVYRRRAVRASRSTQITHRNGCNICSRIPALLSS